MEKSKKSLIGLLLISLLAFSVAPYIKVQAQSCDPDALVPVSYGQRGNAVRNAQLCLMEAGYDIPAGATGYYGSQTRNAVREFYADWYGSWSGNNLGPRGVVELKSRLASSPQPQTGGVSQNQQQVLSQVLNLMTQGKTNEALALLLTLLQQGGQQQPGQQPQQPVTGQVTVSLASDNPSAGTLISSQTNANLLKFVVNNGTANAVTINSLKVKRGGVSSDSTLSNVYLFANDVRVSDPASVSSGYANFTGLNVQVQAGSSVTFAVVADIANGTAGQTVNVSVESATDIGGITVSGNFPISGNTFTIASTPSDFASVTLGGTTEPTGGTVNAGTSAFTVFRNTLTVSRDVLLKSLRLRMIGSIAQNDLQNFGLYVDGTQIATSSLGSDNYVTFNLSNPYTLRAGSRTLEVRADIVGGSTRQFSFSLRYPSDLNVVDAQYGVGVQVSGTPKTTGSVTVSGGSLTIQKLPQDTSYVVKDARKPLAKFEFRAYGEPVKVESLTVSVNDYAGYSQGLRNGAIYVNGSQVGPTLTIKRDADGATTFNNLNFVVNPGTPATVEVWADVVDAGDSTKPASGVNLTITLKGSASLNNAQATQSLQLISAPSSNLTYDQFTVVTGQANLLKNPSYGNQTVVAGQTNVKIGSFVVVANQYEGLTVNSFTVSFSGGAESKILNLKLSVNPNDVKGTPTSTNNFSLNLRVPAGEQRVIDVYADIRSGLTGLPITISPSAQLSYITDSGVSGSISSAVAGQTITIQSSGTLTVTLDSDTPLSKYIVTGATGVEFLKIRVTADNREDLRIEEIKFVAPGLSAANAGYLYNFILTDGSNTYTKGNWDDTSADPYVLFTRLNIVVPKNQSKVLTLKVDVNTYNNVVQNTNIPVSFRVPINGVKYRGVASGNVANTPASNLNGNTMTIYRANFGVSFSRNGSLNAVPNYSDITTLQLRPVIYEPGVTSITFKTMTLTIQTTDIAHGDPDNDLTVNLYDGNTLVASKQVNLNGSGVGTAVFSGGDALNKDIPSSGKDWRIAISGFTLASGTGSKYFTIKVDALTDITWNDTKVDVSQIAPQTDLTTLSVTYTFSR
jgi:hypothetical protein